MTVPFLQSRSIKLKVATRFPALIFGGTAVTVNKANGNYYVNADYSKVQQVTAIPPGAPNKFTLMWDSVLNQYSLAPLSLLGGGGAGGIVDAPSDGNLYGRENAAWVKGLALAGGTLTGPLILAADPTVALGAATKEYVDTAVATGFVPTQQIVTGPGDVTVANSDGLIVLNKTTGQPTNINLPPAATKIGRVKIVDWKGDADVNNFTILPASGDQIMGRAQWVVAAANGSIILDPVRGAVNGYAI